ncbi:MULTISPECIES: pur operon repressor [Clostridium]|uniref:Pur operon repressor n=1 Tax=Clostridium senegalense TaxID=1465809 RepID=A0A6M0H769_9CLOT|nr:MULTISPECIES: pur operon repressor [Clostridium]NEU05691.1 pur operon repressor [Clostridium senegalense]
MGRDCDKFSRNQRIVGITKVLTETPNKVVNLNTFTEMFNAAKSTVSEDVVIVRETLEKLSVGKVETVSGAAGGIKFTVDISEEEKEKFEKKLCEIASEEDRVMVGDFLYVTDLIFNPNIIVPAAKILSSIFKDLDVDYVVTIETKGIPLAYEVAKNLGVQLVTVRNRNKVTEGASVYVNYISGTNKRIQTMSLSRKAMKKNSKCVFIDDFMRGGGTAKGIKELLSEFDSELLACGVLVDNNSEGQEKLMDNYISIIEFNGINQEGRAMVNPSDKRTL